MLRHEYWNVTRCLCKGVFHVYLFLLFLYVLISLVALAKSRDNPLRYKLNLSRSTSQLGKMSLTYTLEPECHGMTKYRGTTEVLKRPVPINLFHILLCACASRRRKRRKDNRHFYESAVNLCIRANRTTPRCTVVGCTNGFKNAATAWVVFQLLVDYLQPIKHAKLTGR